MQLLTPERFQERHAELVELRDKADADYRRANLEAAMGTGTDADVLKARQALDLVTGQLEGLEAARVESKRIQAAETKRAREAAYERLSEDTESLLSEREVLIASIEAKARDLHDDIGKFDALTSRIRAAISVYQPHVLGRASNHVTRNRMQALAPVWNQSLPLMVSAIVRGDNLSLNGATLAATEASVARTLRSQIQQVAPAALDAISDAAMAPLIVVPPPPARLPHSGYVDQEVSREEPRREAELRSDVVKVAR